MINLYLKTVIEDVFILDNDQPTACPYCGVRTEFEEKQNKGLGYYQLHSCNSYDCEREFIGVFE